MRRSTRVAYVVVSASAAALAGAASVQAQSIAEALSGPAKQVITIGQWSTVTAVDPPKPTGTFDHWQAKITLSKPSFGLPGKKKLEASSDHAMTGLASYYWQGKKTATGEAFNPTDLTAAHRTLPFGTRVRVTRVDNGESVIVRINDRGPFKNGRVIDLSKRAAEDLRMTDRGLCDVKLEVLNREDPPRPEIIQSKAPDAMTPHLETVAQRSERR